MLIQDCFAFLSVHIGIAKACLTDMKMQNLSDVDSLQIIISGLKTCESCPRCASSAKGASIIRGTIAESIKNKGEPIIQAGQGYQDIFQGYLYDTR